MEGSAAATSSDNWSDGPSAAAARVLLRHYRLILAFAILGAIGALVYCLLAPTKYRASASLLIEAQNPDVVKIDKVYDPSSTVREYHRTQYELLQSRELVDTVVKKLDLGKHPVYAKRFRAGPAGLVKFSRVDRALDVIEANFPGFYSALALNILRSKGKTLTDDVLSDVRISPAPNTYLVNVIVSSRDPALGAQIANTIVSEYLNRERAARTGLGYEAAGLLTQRVDESRLALQASEQALQKFLEKEDLINVGGVRNLVEDEITERTRRLRDARAQRMQLSNVYTQIRSAGDKVERLQDIPMIQDDPLVRDTKTAYLSAKEAFEQIRPRYGERHPSRIAAQARFNAASDAYFTQLRIRAEGIRNDYEVASRTESELQAGVSQSTTRIQNLDRKDYQLRVLQRDVDTNRDLYETFLKRLKETQATADLELGNARVIDHAVPALKPSWPRPLLIVPGGALIGFVLGCALAFIRKALDNTFSSLEQLEAVAGAPVLCALPHVTMDRSADRRRPLSPHEISDPRSTYTEGLRTLRTSVLLQDRPDRRMRRIMICSSMPSDGKTSIACNLAAVLSERERVLLVDTDLRKPQIAGLYKLPPLQPGLIQLLAEEASLDDVIQRSQWEAIDLLPAGTGPDNPQILLASERFRHIIEQLSSRYDRIVFDTAPCPLVSDTLLFANQMDGIVLVARAGKTERKVLASTARLLRNAQAPIIGAVLNDIDPRRGPGYDGGYYYRYGYYG